MRVAYWVKSGGGRRCPERTETGSGTPKRVGCRLSGEVEVPGPLLCWRRWSRLDVCMGVDHPDGYPYLWGKRDEESILG